MTVADIEWVDAALAEDGGSICFYGCTSDPDQTFVWSLSLPMLPITEDAFLMRNWRAVGCSTGWRRHEQT
ncbi:MAG: hypothetical protein EOR00_33345 [Mesorhizobium sp.]|uniref:hypothetical protein n=1 Tax=Mesorhizobium sp. TaxID=1871066 RepID=UPI000FE8F847|nr:hypothetical protein [Mesorhizobium sp.]RWP07749.1 MAG: hypothetical protein EOR00_33345 [Mesorhizobium sp.]